MKAFEAVREAASRSGIALRKVCNDIGKPESTIYVGISRGSTPRADTLAAMLEPCGYVLAAVPVDDLPASAIVVDGKEAGA